MSSTDTRWVRFYRTWLGVTRKSETFIRVAVIGSTDEEELRVWAEHWATDVGSRERFAYGFEIVDRPTAAWLHEEVARLEGRIRQDNAELLEVNSLIAEVDGR